MEVVWGVGVGGGEGASELYIISSAQSLKQNCLPHLFSNIDDQQEVRSL